MLIDFGAFVKSWETLMVAGIMLVASIGGKYLAAIATRRTFRLTRDEGQLIFGMSSASAAATLASVMVGYNIIIGETRSEERRVGKECVVSVDSGGRSRIKKK